MSPEKVEEWDYLYLRLYFKQEKKKKGKECCFFS